MTTTAGAWESSLADPPLDIHGDQRFYGEHLALTSMAFLAAGAFEFLDDPPPDLDAVNEVCGQVQDFNVSAEYYERYGSLNRTFCPAQFSELPDFSHSMEDYINQNNKCPPYLDWDAKECHSFTHFMGALNSNHFPPQLKTNYTRYHQIALAVFELGEDLYNKLSNARALSENLDHYAECRLEALTYESIAQHYLQDQWSMGHMWSRWGGPEVADFPTTDDVNVFGKIILGGIAHGAIVGAVSGLIHGWRSTVQNVWLVSPSDAHDEMSFNAFGVEWRSYVAPEPPGFLNVNMWPGWGDMYLGETIGSKQDQMLYTCMETSLRQLEPFEQPEELHPLCWSNFATNLAMDIGLNMSPSSAALHKIEVVGRSKSLKLVNKESSVKIEEASRELTKLSAIFKAAGVFDPHETYLARGYTSKRGDTRLELFSIQPNDAYNRPPSYMDPARYAPGDPADTHGVQPDQDQPLFGVRQIRYFNKCHAELYCKDLSIINKHREGCRSTSNPNLLDCQICEELAGRFFVGNPPLCKILAPGGSSLDPSNPKPPRTSQEVEMWCRSTAPGPYRGEIYLAGFSGTRKYWDHGVAKTRTFKSGWVLFEGRLNLFKQGKRHVYSGIWKDGGSGMSEGGNMRIVVDSENKKVIEFSAQNLIPWFDCGPADYIGRDEGVRGPKPGVEIPISSYGQYGGQFSVNGSKICLDYVTPGNIWSKSGCPDLFDEIVSDENVSIACDDSTELRLTIALQNQ